MAVFLLVACQQSNAPAGPTNLIVITIDTLRADRLGAYGYDNAGTTNLDELAAKGALFEHAFSSAPVTTPSHSTIMTGTYQPYHGVRDNGLFVLPESALTLAEILQENGFQTSAFVGSFPTSSRFGLQQGFEHFDDDITVNLRSYDGVQIKNNQSLFFDERNSSRVNERFFPWLQDNHEQAFFTWLHYWDPHHPHIAPEPFASRFAHDPYQAEISFSDSSVGQVIAQLKALNIYEDTLIVIVADHGEGLGQHNEATHSYLAYNSTLHVPFIFHNPGLIPTPVRIAENVGSIDLSPTVLGFLGIPVPMHMQGRDLQALIAKQSWAEDPERPYYAEALSAKFNNGWGELRVLFQDRFKYIHGPKPELFNIDTDFKEWDNLIAGRAEFAEVQKNTLSEYLTSISSEKSMGAITDTDNSTLQRLAGLGYISNGDKPEINEALSNKGIAPQDRAHLVNLNSRLRGAFDNQQYLHCRDLALRMLNDDPNNGTAHGYYALSLLFLDQTDVAFEYVKDNLAYLVPSNLTHFSEVIRQYSLTGNNKTAGYQLLQSVIELLPSAQNFYLLAQMSKTLDTEDQYEKHLLSALALQEDFLKARLDLAIYYAQNDQSVRAKKQFSLLLDQHPQNAKCRYNYALFLFNSNQYQTAQIQVQKALLLQPRYPAARVLNQRLLSMDDT